MWPRRGIGELRVESSQKFALTGFSEVRPFVLINGAKGLPRSGRRDPSRTRQRLRRHRLGGDRGITLGDVLGAEIVTADGRLLRVDAEEHPDLFWAIRGGGNFGVVSRFHYRLHEVDEIVGGMLIVPVTSEVIHSFVAQAEAAPEELSTIANVMAAPPMPFLPAEVHGRLIIMAMLVYAGEVDAGERAIAPFRTLAIPIVDMVKPMRYPEIYPPEEDDYHPVASGRTMFLDAIDHSVAETIVEYLQASSAQMAVAQIRVLGGAMARVPVEATAFAHRSLRIMVNVAALY
jgi:hypothetical protein